MDACMFAAADATCAATGENMNATRFSFGCSAMSEAERPALPNAAKGGKLSYAIFNARSAQLLGR
jgi:hypothetical protein